jgi:hypothetical protein
LANSSIHQWTELLPNTFHARSTNKNYKPELNRAIAKKGQICTSNQCELGGETLLIVESHLKW